MEKQKRRRATGGEQNAVERGQRRAVRGVKLECVTTDQGPNREEKGD